MLTDGLSLTPLMWLYSFFLRCSLPRYPSSWNFWFYSFLYNQTPWLFVPLPIFTLQLGCFKISVHGLLKSIFFLSMHWLWFMTLNLLHPVKVPRCGPVCLSIFIDTAWVRCHSLYVAVIVNKAWSTEILEQMSQKGNEKWKRLNTQKWGQQMSMWKEGSLDDLCRFLTLLARIPLWPSLT